MSLLTEILVTNGPTVGWALVILWGMWQLYCPLPNHTTKLQQFHDDLTLRLRRIELTQIALAEEVTNVDEGAVRNLHEDEERMRSADLKREGRARGEP